MVRWVALVVWLFTGVVAAQEIRCNQVFMNPSEKAVCASPELLAIDAQMAQAYRDAKPHLKGIRKDQRAFKRERKACKGDMVCLLRVYETHIAELRSAVPPEDPVVVSERYESVQPHVEPPMPGIHTDASQTALARPVGDTDHATPPEVSAVANSLPSTPSTPSRGKDTSVNWIVLGVVAFAAIAAIVSFVGWLFKAVGRCPRCTKWWAAEEVGREEHVGTEYETVRRTDERRNRAGNLIETVHRKEQVAHSVVRAAVRMKCRCCGHIWIRHDKRRI